MMASEAVQKAEVLMVQECIKERLKMIKRPGMDAVLKFLDESDYFTSPASSKPGFHNCHEGGLAKHSLDVYECMQKMNALYHLEIEDDSMAIVGLLHDFCKIGHYEENILKTTKKRSDKVPYKTVDTLAVGHGEKSVIMLLRLGMELTDEEILGIRWHMNAFDDVGVYKSQHKWNDMSILCFISDYFTSRFVKKEEVTKSEED